MSRCLIIILNWNKQDNVINLLKQIKEIDYVNYECLVVDNNSNDNSIIEIKKNFPKINILQNNENLGGTGGYNSGIRYALQNISCDYIWLIDNDAEITQTTLSKLVEVLDKDKGIGIAGSRLVDINNKETTIELGSFFRWDTIGVQPFLRNKIINQFDYDYIETDYVAICSAIVRCSALKETNLMDERYFIFWDDMDWGLQFKKAGYKVVAVPDSIAFHPSFTERGRGIFTDYYYGLRNPLLVYTKHTKIMQRAKIFYNFVRQLVKLIIFMRFTNMKKESKLAIQALKDFSNNQWGKYEYSFQDKIKNRSDPVQLSNINANKVLVISDNILENIIILKKLIENNMPNAEITLMVNDDRKELFEEHFSNLIIIAVKKNNSFFYNFSLFKKLFVNNYDIAISTYPNPFTFAVSKSFYFVPEKYIIESSKNDRTNIFIPIISTIFGEIIALFITPYLLIKSLKYNR